MKGAYNKANAAAFSRALNQHINQAGVQAIEGTYRGVEEVIHYVDPKTGLDVMTDLGGKFISGWKLSATQLQNVLTRGSL